jgi:peptidoglycan/LPS O-acetylase OafA/YrhL
LDHKYRDIGATLALFILLISISSTIFIPNQYFADLLVGIASSIFIYMLIQYNTIVSEDSVYPKVVHLLANFSYTLYLVHMPFLVFINALILKENRWQPDALHIFFGLVLFVITIAYSFIISYFTEAKTTIVRNWLVNRFVIKS